MWRAWMRLPQAQALLGILVLGLSGCASLTPISGIPAHRVPQALQAEKRADKPNIDLVRLRQDPPDVYQLAPGDIVGIYIEGVLGDREQALPVNFSENGDLPPSVGYPVPVRENGTISLPLVDPILAQGLSLAQLEEEIRRAYTVDRKILQPGNDRIIVTLMKRRTYQVLVIREDGSQIATGTAVEARSGSLKKGAGFTLNLPAYENDVLHALTETGGLPGFEAQNEVIILRGAFEDAQERDKVLAELLAKSRGECYYNPPDRPEDPNIIRIPLRYDPGNPPTFSEEDIILRTGDIVLIESREQEFYYTGGLLGGGKHPLPRDYDLDVLGAIAEAGGPIAGGTGGGRGNTAFRTGGAGGLVAPTQIIIVRTLPGGGQIPIKVDLRQALLGSSERILIQPGDVVILKYKPQEFVANAILGSVGINFLFNDIFND